MKTNEGKWDRIIRVILGLILIYVGWAVVEPRFGLWSIVALVVGVILLVTGAIGYCALYSVFKISTKKEA